MTTCDYCTGQFEPKHSRHRFCSADCRRGRVPVGSHVAALIQQVEAMATGQEHKALIAIVSNLAVLLDAAATFDDKLYREYRLALKDLEEVCRGGNSSDSYVEFIESLRSAPAVRNS